eukprot:m.125929 g.125929  ORF g.125929 m.125929 type:complete len:644 (+) comp16665_c0_seq1:154-2085(+)
MSLKIKENSPLGKALAALGGPDNPKVYKATYLGSHPVDLSDDIDPDEVDKMLDDVAARFDTVLKKKTGPKVFFVTSKQVVGAVLRKELSVVLLSQSLAISTHKFLDNGTTLCYVTTNLRFGFSFCHCMKIKQGQDDIITDMMRAVKQRSLRRSLSKTSFQLKTDLAPVKGTLGLYTGRYLGSTTLTERGTDASCQVALDALEASKKKKKSDYKNIPAVVIITREALRSFEAVTEEQLDTVALKDVSFASVLKEGEDEEVFVVVQDDERLDTVTAHFFVMAKDSPDEACRTIGRAKDLALEENERKSGNPFYGEHDAEPLEDAHPLYSKQIPREDLYAVATLGAGQFGTVYLAMQAIHGKEEPEKRAVKMLRQGAAATDEEEFLQEAETMLAFDHPNVCGLVGVCVKKVPWMVVVEFMMYGDLRGILKAYRAKSLGMTGLEQLRIAQQMALGMEYIADQGYVHMDLASRNVLVNEGSIIKIGDFGITQKMDEETKRFRLTKHLRLAVRWMAPETLGGKRIYFSEYTDVYSYGVTLWELYSYGILPFQALQSRVAREQIREGLKLDQPTDCPDAVWKIISSCWADKPTSRPRFSALYSQLEELALQEPKKPAPRDIGRVLNAELSKKDRRASLQATMKRKVAPKN